MKLGTADECAACNGSVRRKIEALNTATTCPSKHGDKWGKERWAGRGTRLREVGIPRTSPVGNELKQEQYQSCKKTPQYGVAASDIRRSAKSPAAGLCKEEYEEQGQTGLLQRQYLNEINMHLLWRPLGDALAQGRIIDSSHCRQF